MSARGAAAVAHHDITGLSSAADPTIPVVTLRLVELGEGLWPFEAAANLNGFHGQAGAVFLAEGDAGPVALVGLGAPSGAPTLALRGLPVRLPAGDYRLEEKARIGETDTALAWALGARKFERYKHEPEPPRARLIVSPQTLATVAPVVRACTLVCDLVDTPANDMGPAQLEAAARALALEHGAQIQAAVGQGLVDAYLPAIHAVGRAAAADRAPRMIEMFWTGPGGDEGPKIALIGKGVTFDTGGLDLKPSAGMRLMKKDMAGAAHALGLAGLIMAEGLPVRLSVLIPAVENAVSGESMRPGDVLMTRKGLTVEIGNTDAEGRLILADAMTLAYEFEPDLTLDFATLTGAARIALGPQITPFFTEDDALAAEIAAAGVTMNDALWRMPLWAGYEEALSSDIADLKNDAEPWAQAGAVTAALFLKRFAPPSGSWAHFDIFGWNPKASPGHPVGGEAQTIRALHRVLVDRYGKRA